MKGNNLKPFYILIEIYKAGEISKEKDLYSLPEYITFCLANEILTLNEMLKWTTNVFIALTASCGHLRE